MSVASLFSDALMSSPHEEFRRLRAAAAVHEDRTPDGEPVWVITRYAEARDALADQRLSLNKANARTSGQYQSSMPPELDAHLLNMDAPDHTRLRRLVSKAFTPRRVDGLRFRIQQRVDELLDACPRPAFDLMSALAEPLPMTVICDLLGIPAEDRRDFRAWTSSLMSPRPGAAAESRAAMRDMYEFLLGILAHKRLHPTDDLLSDLLASHDEHDRLTEAELVSLSFLLLFAGYDNAVHLIGNAVLGLLLQPEHWKALGCGGLPPRLVIEETLRWNPPFPLAVRRFALQDLAIDGVSIPAGGRIWVALISANRDEAQFESPDEFNPYRTAAHLSFGHGAHYCLGAPLARLEAEIALTTLVRRRPDLALAAHPDELRWWPSFHKRGLQELPARWSCSPRRQRR
ncbi:cytochrome P450 [Streptomyces sp. NPDC006367]|uniref:cytochrome P450 family protein n=1 Tax=unclassified Streptomyces TaxID=2593676 RepID=UPI0033A3ACEA